MAIKMLQNNYEREKVRKKTEKMKIKNYMFEIYI